MNISAIRNDYVSKVLSSFYWFFSSAILTQLILFISQIISVRVFHIKDVSEIILLITNVSLLSMFILLGVGSATSKYISDSLSDDSEFKHEHVITGSLIVISLSLSLLSIAVFTFVGYIDFGGELKDGFFSCLIAGALAYTLDGLLKSILIGHNARKVLILYSLISVVFYPFLIYFFSNKHSYIEIYFLCFVIQFLVALIIFVFFSLSSGDITKYTEFKSAGRFIKRTFFKTMLPALLSGLLVLPINSFIQWFVYLKVEGGQNILAIIGISMQWFNMIQFIPIYVSKAIISHSSSSSREGFINDYDKMIVVNYFACVAIAFTFISASFLSGFLYSIQSDLLHISILIAVFAAFFKSIGSPFSSLIMIKEKMWLGMLWNFIWAMFYVTSFMFFHSFGLIAIMLCFMFSYIVQFLISAAWYYFKENNLRNGAKIE